MKWIREPLVHFLLIGALLFALYGVFGDDDEDPNEIVVTEATVDHLIELWIRTRQRPPTQDELRGLIDDYVIEEILYREGMAMGLDEDDTIIRRRVRQKMEFLADDLASIAEPTDADLEAYLAEHPDQFRIDATISFSHVFFNVDRRGDVAFEDAGAVREQLAAGHSGDPMMLGDGLPLPSQMEASSTREVAAMFGPEFADRLAELNVGEWAGPVPSGYGLHVVRVTEFVDGRIPELDEVRDAVEREWSSNRRKEIREKFYDSFRERYTVTIEVAQSTDIVSEASE